MKYLSSVADAILSRTPEELIGALLVAAAVAIVAAGLYALGRRKAPRSATFVGGLALAAGVSCMALAAGYIEYAAPTLMTPEAGANSPTFPGWSSSRQGRNASSGPWAFYGAGWSSGFHVVVAADEDRNGRLTPEEAARLVRKADTDGDGTVDFRDIDRWMLSRFRPRFRRPESSAPGRTARERVDEPPDGPREPPPGLTHGEDGEQSVYDNETVPGLDKS